MDPLKKDQEWLGDDKQTPGQQDDSGKGGGHEIDNDGLSERQQNQVAGLKNALDTRDADISLLEEHGLRFMADRNYLTEIPEEVWRKLIDRLKRTKSISIDMEYDDIVKDLNGWDGKIDEWRVVAKAVKQMTTIQEQKEADHIYSTALDQIEDPELKKRFETDYAELSFGKKLPPAATKKLTETILKGYRFEIQSQRATRDRTLGVGASAVQGSKIGQSSAQSNSRKHYENAVALWWSDQDLAKYYPEFHKPKQ